MANRGLAAPSKRRHGLQGRIPIGACVAATALATLGCATTSAQSVATPPPPVAEAPPAADLGLVPNDVVVGDAARSCALIGDGLKPRLVAERELGRADFGNSWVRYTFRCEAGDDEAREADLEAPGR